MSTLNTVEQSIIQLQLNVELLKFLEVKLHILKCDFSASASWRCSSPEDVDKSCLALLNTIKKNILLSFTFVQRKQWNFSARDRNG